MTDIKALLDFIAGPESKGNYNAYYGNTNNQEIKFTDMTIAEVQAFQADLARQKGSSAVGRYQFLQGTLGGLVNEMGLSPSTRFSPELQDQLGQKLLERRGLNKFNSGQMSAEAFGNSLAQEWAGLPMVSGPKAGRSYYDGDAIGNKSGVSAQSFLSLLSGGRVEVPTPLNPTVQPGTPLSEFVHSQTPSATGQSPRSYSVGGQGSVAINDVWATQPVTHTQQLEYDRKLEEDRTSLIEGMGIAISQEQILPWLLKSRPEFTPVPGHQTDWDEVTKDIPEMYWDRFVGSSSPAQDGFIRESIMQDLEADQKLSSMGGMGLALRIGAGVFDPAAWAAAAGITATTAGAGLPAFLAAKFGRAGMVGYGAAVGAAGALPTEAALAMNKPTYDWSSGAMSIGAGAVLGGAFGALARNPHVAEQAKMIERTGEDIILSEMRQQNMSGSSVGAMQAAIREDLRSDVWDIVRDGKDLVSKPFARWARFDLSAMLKGSDNTFTRILGANLVEDGARNAGEKVTEIGASEVATRLHRLAEVRWRKSYDANFKAYAKRLGVKWGDMGELRGQYSRKIAEYVRSRNPMEDFDPEVSAAGNEFRSMMQRWRELAQNPGVLDGTTRRSVRGFEETADNAHYVPRIFDLGAVQDKLMKYGHERLATLIAKGMQEVNEDISDDLAMKFGRGYIKRLHALSAGDMQRLAGPLSGEDMDGLKSLLRDGTDLSDAELDDLLMGLKPDPKTGAVTRAKQRLFYDENFAQQIETIDGTSLDMVRISDLFNNDADALMASYSRQMAGRVAMARLRVKNPQWQEGDEFSPYLIDGVTNDIEWATTLEKVRAVGDTIGAQAGDQSYAAKLTGDTMEDIKRLQFAYDNIVGRPRWDESSSFSQFQRVLRDTNFLRVMGQVGFAQIPEFANATWQVGLKAMFSNMPSFRSMWRNAKTGQIDDVLAQEWEDITGLGTDWLRHSDGRRMDDFDNPLAGIDNNRVLAKVDDFQQKGKRAMTALSGMAPINTVLQRLTGRAIFNKFAILAKSGKEITADRRMLALGLDTEMLKRVTGQINAHATFNGTHLKAMNFSKWADQEALANFENAVFRLGRNTIQENDIGNMAMWMSRPTARTLLQFRSFMLAAWSKQFLQGLNMRDFTTFATFTSTAFLASMTYIAREQLNAIGRPDAKERLGERLSLEKIAAAGLQNSSWFTLLAPGIDTTRKAFGADPWFDARTTQQSSDAIFGNPTVGFMDSAFSAPVAGLHAMQGDFSQKDAQKLRALLPFQNLMGVTQLYNTMVGPLPEANRR